VLRGLKKDRSSGWRVVWLGKHEIVISCESASSSSSNSLQWEALATKKKEASLTAFSE
jgi:hypothetical protein